MANKKRNKKQNKQKCNNNRMKNSKNGSIKNRQNSEQSIESSKSSKGGINGVSDNSVEPLIDLFKDELNMSSNEEKDLAGDVLTLTTISTNYSPKGLNNLGNTCYFNSVLQIISETHLLFELLNKRSNSGYVYKVKSLINPNEWSHERPFDEELESTLEECFPLTQNLVTFMREMRSNGSRTVSPSKILRNIQKEWTQFEGWAQQDSHELLRCLLDSLKCKEMKRQRKAIINQLVNRRSDEEFNLDDDTKAKIKSYITYSSLTPIDTVFGGQLLSCICCQVCHNSSLTFEPFFDLSLPLTNLVKKLNNSVLIVKNEPKMEDNESSIVGSSEEKISSVGEHKKLTPKERRQQRQQKKATKRQLKLQKKTLNTISFENKENYNNCDINTENTKQMDLEENPETSDWPQVGQWNDQDFDTNHDNKDLSDHQNNDSNQLTDSQEMDRKASEDWTNAWITNDYSSAPIHQTKQESDEDFQIEPLLSDFDEKLVIRSDTNEWDVNERPFRVPNDTEEDTNIDMLYNCEHKNNEDMGWNGWNDEDDIWPTNDEQPVFGPQLPPTITTDEVEEESDEYKAQELEFQSPLEYETELLMSSISDGQKLEIKNSTNDTSNNSIDFDQNSETIKQIISLSLDTISDNNVEKLPKFDLIRLLSNFTATEWLSGNNKYFCEMCTKANNLGKQFTNASKKALIALPPPVLTLHLKRFEADGNRMSSISLRKISSFVSFPLTFDLSPFVSKMYNYLTPITGQSPVSALIYGLYGVVEHSGSLRSGHYTAYIKFRQNNRNQNKKFAIFEPFLPKVENVLKMIENNFFATNTDSSYSNGSINDSLNATTNGSHTNGSNSTHISTPTVEYSCSATDSGKWFHISDSNVTSSSVNAVLKSNAYILFYERIA